METILTKEILFEIAKIIDNDFTGSEDTFTAERKIGFGYNFLSTGKCDNASFIKVYHDFNSIQKIEIGHEDGWREIMPFTKLKVNKYIGSLTLTRPK